MESKQEIIGGRTYVIEKIPVFTMQKILFHCVRAFQKKDPTVIPDDIRLLMANYIAAVNGAGTPIYLANEELIDINVPNAGDLTILYMKLLEFNMGFLSDGSLFTAVGGVLKDLFPKTEKKDGKTDSEPTGSSKA